MVIICQLLTRYTLRWPYLMFNVYVLFLIASGVLMLVLGSSRAPYAKRRRVYNLAFGAGFTIYGLYLLLFFQGGHYLLFFYAFILPILLTVRFLRDRSAYRAAQAAAAPAGYGQPPAYGQAPVDYVPPGGYAQPGGYGQPGGGAQQPPVQP